MNDAESDDLLCPAGGQHYQLARRVLESDDGVARWLAEPQVGLGGLCPAECAHTEAGAQEVEKLLLRIEHGVYS